jgi:hypothetical protein
MRLAETFAGLRLAGPWQRKREPKRALEISVEKVGGGSGFLLHPDLLPK